MRIGVYPGSFPPEEGGGHTFVSTVFDGFLSVAASSRHRFVVLSEPLHASALAPRCAAAGVEMHRLRPGGKLALALSELKHYSPLAHFLRKWPGRIERASRESAVDLVWFVAGLAYEALETPYIGTVWDLQHRLHPWFPEMSSDGYWEHRELVYTRFLRRATHLITGTRIGAEQLRSFYDVAAERISMLAQPAPRIGADTDGVAPGIAASLPANGYFFYPAQFWAHKNHVNLLHALKLLQERDDLRPPVVFTGSDKGNLAHVKGVAGALGLAARVHFAGFVNAAELVWLYRNALALVYPSFNGPDNLPPLEAFSLGCPVALSDYPGASEQTGDAALRFDPRRPEDIARTLKILMEDANQRQQLIRRGDLRVQQWTAVDYIRGVFAIFDEFENVRRCWR